MKSSSLLAILDGSRSPQVSKTIQKVLLAVAEEFTEDYGVKSVPLRAFSDIVNETLSGSSVTPLADEDLRFYLAELGKRLSAKSTPLFLEDARVGLRHVDIEWDDFDPGDVRRRIHERYPIRPEAMRERLHELEDRSQRLAQRTLQLRFTSPIVNAAEIYDAISKIINSAKTRLYIMIAFFGDELKFFPEFVAAVANVSDLDVRVLIRDPGSDAPANRELATRLRGQFVDRDVVRIYGGDYAVSGGARIGNLHSKMMLSEQYLLVGSANLTTRSLGTNEESAVFTNDPELVQRAYDHFRLVWNQFKPIEG